ncbi:thiamine phosphate synthase [Tunturiibacter lichenicola]|uniref:thiamine phosphate synthase n=1 Tax=Tunturiibacter lichenicola TaxID=2051959 RepID=UPI0021B49669|nr:thiamine phosphate synthase [Edaphobacter lichenicola]
MAIALARLYPIVDEGLLSRNVLDVASFAEGLREAGVRLVQYRNKVDGPQKVLQAADVIRGVFANVECRLILNDRADLAVLAGWDGVHVGQGDLSPEDSRRVVGPKRWVGVSTHTEEQVRLADSSCTDYVAVGPVFVTGTKLDAEPVIGLAGVKVARSLTKKPIVAIGGITRENARSVIDAGADSVAVISALIVNGEPVAKVARDFLDVLR